jgi:hypothetical protein
MAPSRPPTLRRPQASGRARSSASSSPLTAIRIAWKVRFAGCPRPKRSDGGIAALIAVTSWAVVSIGRRLTISRAIAELPDRARQTVLGPLVDDCRGRKALGRVHAHVERRVVGVGEAALPGIDLHRGHAEVEDDPVGPDAFPPQALERDDEVGAQEAGAAGQIGRELPPALLRGRVAVDRDQLAIRTETLGDQARVAAAAEGAVDEGLARPRVEHVDQLLGEDRFVFGGHITKVR